MVAVERSQLMQEHAPPTLLRVLTCGSVDDGKSTLIGRLLHDTRLILEDQLAALARDSRKYGTTGEEIDFALLVDGLEAEREQGITIDVAYRFFSTPVRKFIVADTPGHEQYTRNMATGASTADLAILLIDARSGVLGQTRRHSIIASLLGIRHVVLAVNKMDLVGFSRARFEETVADYRGFAQGLAFDSVVAIPISARFGDNVVERSASTPWFDGPTLMRHLEEVEVETALDEKPFRMSVQWVNRPNLDFRGYAGTISAGRLQVGDEVVVARSGRAGRVARLVTYDGDREAARAGDAVTLVLDEALDVSRGDLLAPPKARPHVADQLAANLLWLGEAPMLPGRPYLMKIGARTVSATVSELKYRLDVNTLDHLAGKTLAMNEIGFCNLSLSEPVAFDAYEDNRDTGAFILIDRFTNATVGAGMAAFPLRRATNIHWQALAVGKGERAALKHQRPAILWFTGLSGAGKSTIANAVECKLHLRGHHTYLLDGDNVRHGLNRDLGFTDADRVENIRRVAETAKLFVDAGLIVLVSFISPFRSERRFARELVETGEFIEVFIDTPLEVCEARDPKGLYKRARAGEIANMTGLGSPYETPEAPELRLQTAKADPDRLAEQVVAYLQAGGYLGEEEHKG
jgi:bifunctional enzyme CysN/CysC